MDDTPPSEPQKQHVFEWRGFRIDHTTLTLFGQFWISLLVGGGCVWIILSPTTNNAIDNAAFALLGVVVQAWLQKRPGDV